MGLDYRLALQTWVRVDGLTPKGIFSPGSGQCWLCQCYRIRCQMPDIQPLKDQFTMVIQMANSQGELFEVNEIPLPSGVSEYTIDVMPFLSNMAAFGLTSPMAVRGYVKEALLSNNKITGYGYVIRETIA